MQHSFGVELAKEYGILEAILIQNIYFWIDKNKANKKHFYDGRYWTYNSRKAFSEMFPYASEKQIRRALEKLEKLNILITGNYNKQWSDRTLWYSFSDVGLSIVQKRQMQLSEKTNDKCPNGQMTNAQEGKAIPYINTNINTDNNYIIPIPFNDNIECESNCNNGNKCSKTAKLKINGHCFCGQHSRIYLTKLGYFEFEDFSNDYKKENSEPTSNLEAYKEIVGYMNVVNEHHRFNKKIPFSYKYQSKATQKLINARLREGYDIEEFKDVIWWGYKKFVENEFTTQNGESSYKYFRPSTLFSTEHFEAYLNEYRANTQ